MSRPQGTRGAAASFKSGKGARARTREGLGRQEFSYIFFCSTQTDTSLERVALHGIFPKLAAKRVHPAQGKLASPFQSVGVQVAGVDLLSGLTKLEAEAALRSGTLESAYLREIDEYRPFIIAVVGASAAQPSPSPPPPARRTPSPSPAPPDPPGAAPPPNAPDGPSSTAAAELLTAAPGAVPVEGAAGAGDDPAPPQPEEAHRFPEEEEEEEDGARLGERVLERVLEAAVLGEAVPEAQRRRAVLCLPRPTRPGPDDAPGSLRARLRRLQGPRLLDGYDDPRDAAAFALQARPPTLAPRSAALSSQARAEPAGADCGSSGAGGRRRRAGVRRTGGVPAGGLRGDRERPTALAHLNLEVLAPGGDDGDDEADGEAARVRSRPAPRQPRPAALTNPRSRSRQASPRDGAPGLGPELPPAMAGGARVLLRAAPGAGRTALLARWASSLRGRPERYALVAHFEEGPEPPPGAPPPPALPPRPLPPAPRRRWRPASGRGRRAAGLPGGPLGPDEEEALESGAEERGAGLPPGSIALRASSRGRRRGRPPRARPRPPRRLQPRAARAVAPAARARAAALVLSAGLTAQAPPGWRALDLPPLSPTSAAPPPPPPPPPAAGTSSPPHCSMRWRRRRRAGRPLPPPPPRAALAPDAAAGPAAAPPRSSRRGCWAPAPTPPASRRAAWGSSRGGTLRLGCGGPCAPSSAAAPASRTTSSSSSPAPSPLLGRRRRLRRHPPPPPPRPGAPRRGRDGHPGGERWVLAGPAARRAVEERFGLAPGGDARAGAHSRLADFFAPRLLAAAGSGPAAPAPEALPFELRRAIAELPWQLAERRAPRNPPARPPRPAGARLTPSGCAAGVRGAAGEEEYRELWARAGAAPGAGPHPLGPLASQLAGRGGPRALALLRRVAAHMARRGPATRRGRRWRWRWRTCGGRAARGPRRWRRPSGSWPPAPRPRGRRLRRRLLSDAAAALEPPPPEPPEAAEAPPPPKSEALARALRRLGRRRSGAGRAGRPWRPSGGRRWRTPPATRWPSSRPPAAPPPAEADALLQAGPLPSPPSSPRLTAAPAQEAEGLLEGVVGPAHPRTAAAAEHVRLLAPPTPAPVPSTRPGAGRQRSELARAAGDAAGAARHCERALAAWRCSLGDANPYVAASLSQLARARRPLPLLTPSFLPLRPRGAQCGAGLGELARARGLYEAARACWRRSTARATRARPPPRAASPTACASPPAAARPTSPPPAASTRPPCPASAPARLPARPPRCRAGGRRAR
eukprot:tig00021537_g22331.t1